MSLADITRDTPRRHQQTEAIGGGGNTTNSLDPNDCQRLQQSSSHAIRIEHVDASTHPSMSKENHDNRGYQQQPHRAGYKRHWQESNASSYRTQQLFSDSTKKRTASTLARRNMTAAIKPVSASSLLEKMQSQEKNDSVRKTLYLIPDCCSRDLAWLKLGLGVTELAGEAGSGKSQMAMSLCVHAVMNRPPSGQGNNHGHQQTRVVSSRAVYISLAGGQASLSRIAYRMQQMADAQQQCHNHQPKNVTPKQGCPMPNSQYPPTTKEADFSSFDAATHNPKVAAGNNSTSQSVLSQILTHSVRNQDDLFALLREDLPLCLQQDQQPAADRLSPAINPQPERPQNAQQNKQPVALIVLDSIADLFRLANSDGAQDKAAILKRSYLLFELAAILKELSDRYNVPILVINQVSCDLASNSNLPALGLSWANCVNTSYVIRRPKNQIIATASNASSTASRNGPRHIFLAKSAKHAVNQKVSFLIGARGVVSFAK